MSISKGRIDKITGSSAINKGSMEIRINILKVKGNYNMIIVFGILDVLVSNQRE